LPRLHPNIAISVYDLGSLYVTEHKFTKAQPLLERLLLIRQEGLGPNDPKLTSPLQALAFLLRKLKRKADAAEVSAQARAALSAASAGLPPASSDRSALNTKTLTLTRNPLATSGEQ
jgi:hypothetical protein